MPARSKKQDNKVVPANKPRVIKAVKNPTIAKVIPLMPSKVSTIPKFDFNCMAFKFNHNRSFKSSANVITLKIKFKN